jgi:hypothetical protein
MRPTTKALPRQALNSVPPKPGPFVFDVTGHQRQRVNDVVDKDKHLNTVGLGNLQH